MREVLPKNWKRLSIKDFAKTQSGGTPSTSVKEYWNGHIPWINSGMLKDAIISTYTKLITDRGLKESSANLFPINTVVIALTGATTGKVGILGIETSTNQSITGIFPNEGYSSKFLFYQLQSLRNTILEHALGTAQPHINKGIVDNLKVLYPPVTEQERIVAKLDSLFTRIELMQRSLDHIPQLLKDFRQQVLTRAVTGKIMKPKCIGRFEDYSIKIITGPFGSALHQSEYINNGIPVINPSHIKNGQIVPDSKIAIDQNKFDTLKAWHLIQGDVLLGRRGEMGRAAFKIGDENMLCGTGSIILRSKSVDSKFLTYYLRSEFCVNYLINNSVGSTMINLNQSILKKLPIPIYSLREQEQIVSIVELSFSKADKIEESYNILKAKISTLPQAILHKAFQGELVEQLPTDGDAKNLLEEIKALKEKVKKSNGSLN